MGLEMFGPACIGQQAKWVQVRPASLQEKGYLATNFKHEKNNLSQNIFISNKI